jgi:hypothetical protein
MHTALNQVVQRLHVRVRLQEGPANNVDRFWQRLQHVHLGQPHRVLGQVVELPSRQHLRWGLLVPRTGHAKGSVVCDDLPSKSAVRPERVAYRAQPR